MHAVKNIKTQPNIQDNIFLRSRPIIEFTSFFASWLSGLYLYIVRKQNFLMAAGQETRKFSLVL